MFSLAAAIGLAQAASAQTFPTQTITFQVAFAAGGIADVVARLVGQKLSERLGHAVVVENRGGAGGNLAAKAVSGAAPDGHTIPRHDHLARGQRDRHQEQGSLCRRSARRRHRGVQPGRARRASQQSGEGFARVRQERKELYLW